MDIFACKSMRFIIVPTLVLLVALATPCRADFELSQVAGLYFLERGGPACEEDIVLHQSGSIVRGDQIRGRNFRCSHGQIKVARGVKGGGNAFTDWFAEGLASVGVFLVGTVDETINCGQRGGGVSEFSKGDVWNFVDTRVDVKLDFAKILRSSKKNSPLKHEKKPYILKDEVEYLIIGEKCLYRQSWYVCFPGSGKVQLRGGAVKRMDEIEIGDEVLVAKDTYSPVYMWSHKEKTTKYHSFVRLRTSGGQVLTLTPSHHIEIAGRLVPAARVKVGDRVKLGAGGMATVVETSVVKERGFYNPQTLHGDIVVDGVVTSTYTKAVQPNKAHALLAPLRALYKVLRGAGAVSV